MSKITESFKKKPELSISQQEAEQKLIQLFTKAVQKTIPRGKFGLLFSGGIDSVMIAAALKKLKCDFTCYTAVFKSGNLSPAKDIKNAKRAAKALGLKLKITELDLTQAEELLKKTIKIIKNTNTVQAGVALTVNAACIQASKDNCKAIFSGMGSDEIFAGYQSHKKSKDINQECISRLTAIQEADIKRDQAIAEKNNLELKIPFLDKDLVEFALKLPAKFKIKKQVQKAILRQAALKLGIPEDIAQSKKIAAQYSSNSHKIIKQLSSKKSYSRISEYLSSLYLDQKPALGALVSSGKDSIYAMHLMKKQGYPIKCIIILRSKNPDSYMFHTPNISMAKLQAESIGLPIIEHETQGQKEKELQDLESALKKAKTLYDIKGITTGALFSKYQKQRIEKIAEQLSLKVFSPLWHMDQEKEMRQILDQGFAFIITKVSAEGLDKTWLNRPITHKDIDRLSEINKKNQINIAFEGGEAETLMIGGPVFAKKIKILKSKIIEESENTAQLIIEKAVLEEK